MSKHTSIVQIVKTVISEQVGVSKDILELDSEPSNIPTWDSLANTMIFLEIKKIINTDLEFEEYLECKNIGDLINKLIGDN